jgi:uncharacterized protein
MMTQPRETLSPCIGVCAINSDTHLCEGCFRTLDEIAGWWDYPLDEKKEIMARTEERRQRLIDGAFFD